MTDKLGAAFTVLVALMVSGAMAVTALSLLASGELVQIGVGAGLLMLTVLGLLLIAGEVRLGAASERLGRVLETEGRLPFDPPGITRLASGRLEKVDADRVFADRKREVELAPDDWRAWWRLAAAYGDARDPRRGRRAMRTAVSLERASSQRP